MDQKADNKLHTIQMSYQHDSKELVCKYYYGEDQPADWPLEMHSGIRISKAGKPPQRRTLLQWLLDLI